ncbi:hypothetical protein CC117_00995 [Parafrankia colletiae]|uniref:NAD-dependent epimerase/dehydratase domain-containing protein n=1 Tax=Parafrankia colletiae TaxID=573497 RepID=A0A1S1RHK3_9ACTN|nr:NAD(P)-dependent oxidoreductase [Parafrankia colletiae]MCK9903287.1 NAD(P)-dependent oxidoreductase [Frankia sp. Cpl3]OHV46258.1 hypothetical protein CC117_00995 [Parafrankia colletiae]
MAKIRIFGAGGFVGTAVRGALDARGHETAVAPAPRLSRHRDEVTDIGRALASEPVQDSLVEQLWGCDVVVNAAGLATPQSAATPELYGANSLWPLVLANACEQAGVPRLVHISSAAVQGRTGRLDERPWQEPVSPYAESKALGERLLLAQAQDVGLRLTVYRPTSVHGSGRALTRSFARFCRRWPLVVAGNGDQPVPACLVGNVGAGVATVAEAQEPPLIALQPYEGQTVRSLYETFAPTRRIHRVPEATVQRTLRKAAPVASRLSPVAWISRRAELLLLGQQVATTWLDQEGFRPPLGAEGWSQLAAAVQ